MRCPAWASAAPSRALTVRLALGVQGAGDEHEPRLVGRREREAHDCGERLVGLVLDPGQHLRAQAEAAVDVGDARQQRQVDQAAELALAGDARDELVAAERDEDADEQAEEERRARRCGPAWARSARPAARRARRCRGRCRRRRARRPARTGAAGSPAAGSPRPAVLRSRSAPRAGWRARPRSGASRPRPARPRTSARPCWRSSPPLARSPPCAVTKIRFASGSTLDSTFLSSESSVSPGQLAGGGVEHVEGQSSAGRSCSARAVTTCRSTLSNALVLTCLTMLAVGLVAARDAHRDADDDAGEQDDDRRDQPARAADRVDVAADLDRLFRAPPGRREACTGARSSGGSAC